MTWVAAVVGLVLLVGRVRGQRVSPRPWRSGRFWGWVVAGWGLFNLVEGTVAHQLLGLHHVRYGPHQGLYDAGFLVLGALLLAGGWAWQRRAGRADAGARRR
ncbi:hypothetical protein Cma02nite_17860 [Cellulomonas marina]|uniref:Predicted membrane protein n=1 Tax=Cellulomonas marina TaxID=988821 RepID=A0A1I0VAK1_9CELL|nr:hypothetical protein Cma02nite_17860 [Cellulomonas marina]SFA73262.1 Predicted membrane protein [Cellulomonas marina]